VSGRGWLDVALVPPGRRRLCLAALAALAPIGGCGLWRPVTVPMRTLAEAAPCAARPDTLLVLLPGSWSMPEEFRREGLVRAVHERRIAADVLLVDAHVGYYADRSILERLKADVVEPAHARGYRHLWLAGISIGGFGAMIYAEANPQDVDGVVALAPYLGSRQIAQQINAAGGLAQWTAPAARPQPGEIDLILWRWLKLQSAVDRPPLFLGYGLDDRFLYSEQLLAAALPPSRVFTAEGGHDWPAWNLLWPRMLDAMPLPRSSDCAVAAVFYPGRRAHFEQ